mgnify:CR=1 FL=1
MPTRLPRSAALALSLAVVAAAGPPAVAADGEQPSKTGEQTQQAQQKDQNASTPEFSDQKLNAFADAYVKVSEVRRAWGPKIRKAQESGNKDKAQTLAKQATGEMRTAVQDADNISMKEYQKIGQAAQQDKQFAQEVASVVQQKMQTNRQGQGQTQQNGQQ